MKKAMALAFFLSGCSRFAVYTNSVEVPIHRVSPAGVGEEIGTIVLADSRKDGLIITTDLKGLTQGEHGFHIHQNPSCAPGEKDGKVIAAGAADVKRFSPLLGISRRPSITQDRFPRRRPEKSEDLVMTDDSVFAAGADCHFGGRGLPHGVSDRIRRATGRRPEGGPHGRNTRRGLRR